MEFGSKYVSVHGARMHYWDVGSGDAVLLFLHGMPTSNYLWRYIIPVMAKQIRCVAPDFIGMGKSDKPNLTYSVSDHIRYLDGFIDALKLKNIILVMHGWGSVIGLDYARRHESNIKGVVLYESYIKPVMSWNELSLPIQQFCTLLKNKTASHKAIVDQNYLVEKMLPFSCVHGLSEETMHHYRAPFSSVESRKVLWQYVNELPLGDASQFTAKMIEKNAQWLQKAPQPKLLFYGMPGFMTTMETVQWARDHFPNVQLQALENAMHCAQESMPDAFSAGLVRWYEALPRE